MNNNEKWELITTSGYQYLTTARLEQALNKALNMKARALIFDNRSQMAGMLEHEVEAIKREIELRKELNAELPMQLAGYFD